MSERYLAIIIGVFLVAMFGSMSIDSYMKSKCRQAGLEANKTSEEIQKICK
jgi:hypothetical protein